MPSSRARMTPITNTRKAITVPARALTSSRRSKTSARASAATGAAGQRRWLKSFRKPMETRVGTVNAAMSTSDVASCSRLAHRTAQARPMTINGDQGKRPNPIALMA